MFARPVETKQDCLDHDDLFLTRDVTNFRRVVLAGIYKDTCYRLLIPSLPLMATTRLVEAPGYFHIKPLDLKSKPRSTPSK
jgi:hypothetical protein